MLSLEVLFMRGMVGKSDREFYLVGTLNRMAKIPLHFNCDLFIFPIRKKMNRQRTRRTT